MEVNEAFAAQYIVVEKELGVNREITNINGSGCGLGHPTCPMIFRPSWRRCFPGCCSGNAVKLMYADTGKVVTIVFPL